MAARFRPGAISESSSSHLLPSVASKLVNPVMFPPGWLSRGTIPLATGSVTPAKTIGIVRVSRWTAAVAEVVAHRTGEPFGTLILAVAVTIIEVALICNGGRSGGKDSARARHGFCSCNVS